MKLKNVIKMPEKMVYANGKSFDCGSKHDHEVYGVNKIISNLAEREIDVKELVEIDERIFTLTCLKLGIDQSVADKIYSKITDKVLREAVESED